MENFGYKLFYSASLARSRHWRKYEDVVTAFLEFTLQWESVCININYGRLFYNKDAHQVREDTAFNRGGSYGSDVQAEQVGH